MDIQYGPRGLTARDPAGQRYAVSRLRNGEHIPTARGRQLGSDWLDFMISVPTIERQLHNDIRGFDPRPGNTYTTFSENDYPGLEAMLQRYLPGVNLAQYLTQPGAVLPQGFKLSLIHI